MLFRPFDLDCTVEHSLCSLATRPVYSSPGAIQCLRVFFDFGEQACGISINPGYFSFGTWLALVVSDLGWVDFDLDVPPSCPIAQPILPDSNLPKQKWADSGMTRVLTS